MQLLEPRPMAKLVLEQSVKAHGPLVFLELSLSPAIFLSGESLVDVPVQIVFFSLVWHTLSWDVHLLVSKHVIMA